ncbi:MAG: glycosyltransferase [Burkholderiales bacterium]|nr:glycosyltransferase [Burkholderiales bacterium]
MARLAEHLFGGIADVAVLHDNGSLGQTHRGKILRLHWKNRWSYLGIAIQLQRLIRQSHYDVVFAFGLFPIAVASMALLGMTNRPKLIINEITRPHENLKNANRFRRFMHTVTIKRLYTCADLITANSIDGLRETCQMMGRHAECGIRLPNIVDADRVGMLATQRSSISICHERYMVWVGRLDAMKRVDTIVEAYSRAGCAGECGLVIVGDGEARERLERLVRSLGVQDSVTFIGVLENPLPILSAAAALVLASEYEGFSNAVLEAMFCDVPVVTSYCSSDAREMCRQGAALGFEVGDVDGLAENMGRIVRNEAADQQLVQQARLYRAPHELKQAISSYEAAIRSVL